VGNSVNVEVVPGLVFGFIIRFDTGTLRGREVPTMTATQGGVVTLLARGGGALIEDVVNQLSTSNMGIAKAGGTAVLAATTRSRVCPRSTAASLKSSAITPSASRRRGHERHRR
jgi:hypothetical protein